MWFNLSFQAIIPLYHLSANVTMQAVLLICTLGTVDLCLCSRRREGLAVLVGRLQALVIVIARLR